MHFPMNRFDAARRGNDGIAAPPSRVARLAPSELVPLTEAGRLAEAVREFEQYARLAPP
jgi:hypothetical protein